MRSPFALSSGLQNTHSHTKNDTLKPAGIYIFFLQKVCKLLVYNMFCSQYDKLTPIPWTKLNLRKKLFDVKRETENNTNDVYYRKTFCTDFGIVLQKITFH